MSIPYGIDQEDGDEFDDRGTVRSSRQLAVVDPPYSDVPLSDEPTGERADIDELYPAVDWQQLWRETSDEIGWLVEPIFERGRLYALYSPPKVGKSLITLEVAAALAAGRSVFGNPPQSPMRVLYVDMENSPADLLERLTALGYGPDDLTNLRYLSFPSLPALDSPIGGQQLLAVAVHHQAEVVVIDTVSRVIAGKENDSDTFHALYRNALAPLKARNITVIRLDHAGKNDEQGQRGSSAKSSDVDVVWKLSKFSDTIFTLQRMAARNAHSPEQVQLNRKFSPLRHEIGRETGLDASVMAVVEELDRLNVPRDYGKPRCRSVLTAAGYECSNSTLEAAVRYRKTCPGQVTP